MEEVSSKFNINVVRELVVIADPKNSPGLGALNQVLPPDWYVNSIIYQRNPSLIGGSFRI